MAEKRPSFLKFRDGVLEDDKPFPSPFEEWPPPTDVIVAEAINPETQKPGTIVTTLEVFTTNGGDFPFPIVKGPAHYKRDEERTSKIADDAPEGMARGAEYFQVKVIG